MVLPCVSNESVKIDPFSIFTTDEWETHTTIVFFRTTNVPLSDAAIMIVFSQRSRDFMCAVRFPTTASYVYNMKRTPVFFIQYPLHLACPEPVLIKSIVVLQGNGEQNRSREQHCRLSLPLSRTHHVVRHCCEKRHF